MRKIESENKKKLKKLEFDNKREIKNAKLEEYKNNPLLKIIEKKVMDHDDALSSILRQNYKSIQKKLGKKDIAKINHLLNVCYKKNDNNSKFCKGESRIKNLKTLLGLKNKIFKVEHVNKNQLEIDIGKNKDGNIEIMIPECNEIENVEEKNGNIEVVVSKDNKMDILNKSVIERLKAKQNFIPLSI